MNVGIAVDNWKLPTFRKNLEEAGFQYTETPAPDRITLMKVETDHVALIKEVIEESQRECSQ